MAYVFIYSYYTVWNTTSSEQTFSRVPSKEVYVKFIIRFCFEHGNLSVKNFRFER